MKTTTNTDVANTNQYKYREIIQLISTLFSHVSTESILKLDITLFLSILSAKLIGHHPRFLN